MKYKVCVISSLYPPYSRGGAERAAELVVQGLKEEGHKVFVVTSSPWRGFFSFFPNLLKSDFLEKSDFIKIYRFFPPNLFSFVNIGRYPLFFRLIWRIFDTFNLHSFAVLWFILKKETPDIVWTHNLTGIGLLIPLLLKILKIPHVHTLHDVSLIEPSGVLPYRSLATISWLSYDKFWSAVTRKLFGAPALVVSPSKWLLDFYLKHGFFPKSRMLVKQNPLNRLQITNQYKYTNNELILLFVGQLEKQKGILFLISALDELAAEYNFKLFAVGGGKLFDFLKKTAKKKSWLVLCGKLDGEDLAKIMEKASLTIVPSLIYENSPTVIYESLTNGIPVIASRVGGIPELVEDGKNGLLFEAGDKEDLKNNLIRILENPQILDVLRQGALTFEAKTPIIYVRDILSLIMNE